MRDSTAKSVAIFFSVMLLWNLPLGARQEAENTAAQTANLVSRFLQFGLEGDDLAESFQEEGLIQEADNRWTRVDETGAVRVLTMRGGGGMVMFFPILQDSAPPEVLAALIAKSPYVALNDGNVLELRLREESISQGGRSGTRIETLHFSLGGGRVERTSVSVLWN